MGRMRMNATDSPTCPATPTPTYERHATRRELDGDVKPGERVVPLTTVGESYFDVRIPGLKMTVVAADGQ